MMNPRFFCPDGLVPDSDMPLPPAVAHHAERVLRLSVGDAVTLFDEDTPAELVAALVPDVLVKGGDYTPDTVVGRDTVEAAGGRVVIIPLVHGHTTTSTLERMRSSR